MDDTQSGVRRTLTIVLLAIGLLLTVLLIGHDRTNLSGAIIRLALIAAALLIAFIPPVQRGINRLATPSPADRARIGALIWVIATAYLACTAYYHGRELYPRLHDECSYMIGAHQVAHGRLWIPQHELADFFESFHLLVKPVYASIYWPGTALMNAPGVWLGVGTWVIPVILAGLAVALAYRIVAELVDGAAGILVAIMLVATPQFRILSTAVLSQVPVMVLGLAMAWAWLRWRAHLNWRWTALIGFFAGWAAITRPVDALAFALPIGASMAFALRGKSIDAWLKHAAFLLAGALPFLLVQFLFNIGVTGKPLLPPYELYLQQSQPGSVYGTGMVAEGSGRGSALPQKQIYYRQLLAMQKEERKTGALRALIDRATQMARVTLPHTLLLALAVCGIVLWSKREVWVIASVVPLFLLLYALNPFFLPHYTLPLSAAVALCVVLGGRAIVGAVHIKQEVTGAFVFLAILFLSAASIPELSPDVHDAAFPMPLIDRVQEALGQIHEPAVVLFRFHPGSDVQQEPVYNWDVAWPDDAPIIRAHDLGARNAELVRYYWARQPRRLYFLFDRADGSLTPLGDATAAARKLGISL